MLGNPFMRKTVGRIATVNRAAMIGGMDVKKLVNEIAKEISTKQKRRLRYPATGKPNGKRTSGLIR